LSLKIGIVGLPNVGKSTLFNALTKSSNAEAENYPFCTIDPNIGIVEVPDERLQKISKIVNPEKTIPTVVEFADIAGLVKGASEGEGLGNQFLHHIRECHAIAHIMRFFEDPNITHVHDKIDPKSDREVIESELILADLQTMEKRLERARSMAKSHDKKIIAQLEVLEKLNKHLNEGKRALTCDLLEEEKEEIKDLHLLTMKPILYIANLEEDQIKTFNVRDLKERLQLDEEDEVIPICAKIEFELNMFSEEEVQEYLDELGLNDTGLHSLILAAYHTLGLQTFFTAGPKEARAWTIKQGVSAPEAAGVIHTDFKNNFIRAEVISYHDYIGSDGELKAKEKGLMRVEGKEYIVKDGDVIYFRTSA
jgi:GTP-binding protein YchF